MRICAIDTSCDETSCAVVKGRTVLSSVVYSQIELHQKWGGVMPSLAKRAHLERIDTVVSEAMKKSKLKDDEIGYICLKIREYYSI